MTKNKSIAIYSRKSKFTGKGESIDNQIELCKQYINTHFPNNGDTPIHVFEDEGFSGGNTERPKFKKMMAEARAQNFSAIVCYRLDRISRNIGDFAKLIEELDGLDISFVSIKEQFDTSSPMGRAMMYISSVFSQLERETIAERIRDNMHELSKTGRWLGGNTPTGYKSVSIENVTVDGKVKKACKLSLVSDEAELVKQIFKLFLENNSLTKAETVLLQSHQKTKKGNLFSRFAIRNILTNPVYMVADEAAYKYLTDNDVDLFSDKSAFDGKHGIMAYNRTLQKPGKAHQIRSIDEWIVSVGKHEALISGADWVQAQKQLGQNRSKTFRKPRSHVALLSGLLYCSCGDFMRPKLSKRLNEQGEQIYSYVCSMKEKSRMHNCQSKNTNGNMLDLAICEEVKRLSADNSEFLRQLEIGKKRFEGNRKEYEDNLKRLQGELTDSEKEISALVTTLARVSGTPSEDYILKQIGELHAKNESLKTRIGEYESLTASHELSDIEFDLIRQMLTSFKDTIDNMDVEQKRAALRTFIKKIVWDGENVHLYLFGSDTTKGIEMPTHEEISEGLKKGNVEGTLCEDSK